MVNNNEKKGNEPDLNVKADGEFVGSAWKNKNEYGNYVSVILNKDIPTGTRLFLSPRKGKEGILGG